MKQAEKTKVRYMRDERRLQAFQIDMKALVPNFFTKSLPMEHYEMVPTKDTHENIFHNSYIELEILAHSDKEIGDTLIRFNSQNEVRIGRILECMDSLAAAVGDRHCFGTSNNKNPFVLVTASVDSINLFETITIN
jgi:hypothetical protein